MLLRVKEEQCGHIDSASIGMTMTLPGLFRDHQWTPAGEKRLTGGANWQPRLGAPNSWGPSVPTAIQTQTVSLVRRTGLYFILSNRMMWR